MAIRIGDRVSHEFVVDETAMEWFRRVSGDDSRIHTDAAYAQERGYPEVIVYGGIMLAQLSHVLGTKLPGRHGTSMRWTIDYRKPLYVNEAARLDLEVVNVSALGVVESKFSITAAGKTVATGATQSIVPAQEVVE